MIDWPAKVQHEKRLPWDTVNKKQSILFKRNLVVDIATQQETRLQPNRPVVIGVTLFMNTRF